MAKISENGGYGIDKILNWKNLTNCEVSINSDITKSEVIFELPINANQRQSTPNGVNDVEKTLEEQILALIGANNKISIAALAAATNQSKRSIDRVIEDLKKNNKLSRIGSARSGKWQILE